MNTVVIIQARMGSTRLPGKVMKKIFGKTVLEHVVQRTIAACGVDRIVIATTTLEQDKAIVEEAEKIGVEVFCGEELDVLSRYYQAAMQNRAETIVRITSDCPLIDSGILSEMISIYHNNDFDYVTNTLKRSFPRGLDIEIFSLRTLQEAYQQVSDKEFKEHVTPYIYTNPERFSIHHYESKEDYSQYRWTLDTEEDWILINKIYENLYVENELFSWERGVELMKKKPELAEINAHIQQKKISYDKAL